MTKMTDPRTVEPTEMACTFDFKQNGGRLSDEKAERIRKATVDAYGAACAAEGIACNATLHMATLAPEKFERWATKTYGAPTR